MPAHLPRLSSLPGPISRFLINDESRLVGLLRTVAGREAPPMSSYERLMALGCLVMLVTMVTVAWLSLDNPGEAMAGWHLSR